MKISVAALATLACANAFTFGPNAVRRASIALDATRQPIMAGNWKMNPATEAEAIALGAGLILHRRLALVNYMQSVSVLF